jgi:hypothetical protein
VGTGTETIINSSGSATLAGKVEHSCRVVPRPSLFSKSDEKHGAQQIATTVFVDHKPFTTSCSLIGLWAALLVIS